MNLTFLRKFISRYRVENEIQRSKINQFELQIYFHIHGVEDKENAKVISFQSLI